MLILAWTWVVWPLSLHSWPQFWTSSYFANIEYRKIMWTLCWISLSGSTVHPFPSSLVKWEDYGMDYINRILDPPATGWVCQRGMLCRRLKGGRWWWYKAYFSPCWEAKGCVILKKDSVPFMEASMRLFPSIFQ